jgi:hypothetical protein
LFAPEICSESEARNFSKSVERIRNQHGYFFQKLASSRYLSEGICLAKTKIDALKRPKTFRQILQFTR